MKEALADVLNSSMLEGKFPDALKKAVGEPKEL